MLLENVRLVGGTNACNGRVEVYHDGQWGTVCDDFFDINDAQVICRQLGYRATASYHRAHYGQGTLPIFLDNLQCTGSEDSLNSCRRNGWGVHNCGHYEDASVDCAWIPSVQQKTISLELLSCNIHTLVRLVLVYYHRIVFVVELCWFCFIAIISTYLIPYKEIDG